jgi:CheY-like chemotaxis protein
LKVLIVDDHAGMRDLIRQLIGGLATQLRECASGEEALALCANFAPDFVTMDVRMSGIDGIACVRQLRQLHPAAHIAVVTQFDHDSVRARAQSAGADAYVVKEELSALQRFAHVVAKDLND